MTSVNGKSSPNQISKTDLVGDELEKFIIDFLIQSLKTDSFQLIPLAGDASNRRYYRVVDNNESWVLMRWEPFVDNDDYPFLSVQRHFDNSGVHVPKVIALSPDSGLILLEDLGDLTLERKFWESQDQKNVLPFYKMAIDQIVKIHFDASQAPNESTCFKVSFDTDKFMWELNYAKQHLFKGVAKIQLNKTEEHLLNEDFLKISTLLDAQPKKISHRDYHSRNLMLKLSKMIVIDFQDARLGPVQYDLVSLLCDSYVNLEPKIQQILIQYYLEIAHTKYNQYYDLDEFMYIFKVQLVQRCLKACGSFSSFLNLRDDKRYLNYIPPTLRLVVKTLEELDDFKNLYKLIVGKGLLDIDYEAL